MIELHGVNSETKDVATLLVFEANGVINRVEQRSGLRDEFHGFRQFHPIVFSHGIVFPKLTGIYQGAGNTLLEFEVFIMREAEFNVPLEPEKFNITVEPKTVVADFRGGGPHPKTSRTELAADNAIDAANQPQKYRREAIAVQPAIRKWWWVVLIVNVIAAVLVFGGFRIARSKTNSSS